jgi:hypothetical protein
LKFLKFVVVIVVVVCKKGVSEDKVNKMFYHLNRSGKMGFGRVSVDEEKELEKERRGR